MAVRGWSAAPVIQVVSLLAKVFGPEGQQNSGLTRNLEATQTPQSAAAYVSSGCLALIDWFWEFLGSGFLQQLPGPPAQTPWQVVIPLPCRRGPQAKAVAASPDWMCSMFEHGCWLMAIMTASNSSITSQYMPRWCTTAAFRARGQKL